MRSLSAWAVIFLLSSIVYAQTKSSVPTASGSKAPGKPTVKRVVRPAAKAPAEYPELMKLREAIESQQQQIQQLRDELGKRDAAMQQMQQRLTDLQTASTQDKAALSNSKETASDLREVTARMAEWKTEQAATAIALQSSQKKIAELDTPPHLHFKGITITPGGFLAANAIGRARNTNSDVADSFGSIPFNNTSNAHMTELRFSARHSRLSLRGDADFNGMKALGYFEMDFLGAAPTANETQSNSFTPRTRLMFLNIDMKNGISYLGGQTWSLLNANRRGIAPLTELIPTELNASYHVGFTYARQTTFRITKNFNDKVWAAFAIENPETVTNYLTTNSTTSTISPYITVLGLQNSSNTTSASNGFAGGVSTDRAPDLVAKVAFEPGWGHYEISTLLRFFRDRIATTTGTGTAAVTNAHNESATGGGLGLLALLPVVPKKVDIWAHVLGGRGVGRFGTVGGPDVTLRPDGRMMPVLGYQGTIGVETHLSPKFDMYMYGGGVYYGRTYYKSVGPAPLAGTDVAPVYIGYGSPFNNVAGCTVEFPKAGQSCNAQNKAAWEVTPGFWINVWRGKQGTMRYGMSYAYVHRTAWSGLGGPTGITLTAPSGFQNIILSSFRYILP